MCSRVVGYENVPLRRTRDGEKIVPDVTIAVASIARRQMVGQMYGSRAGIEKLKYRQKSGPGRLDFVCESRAVMPDDKASLGEQVLVMNGVLGKLYNTLVSSDPSNSNVSLQVSFANKGFLRMFNLSQMIRERHSTSRGSMEPTTLRAPFRKV